VLLHRGEVAVIQGDADIQQEVAAGRHWGRMMDPYAALPAMTRSSSALSGLQG
jgi:hypothetical protein